MTTAPRAGDLQLADDLFDAVISKVNGNEVTAAALAIPHLKADPVLAGSFLMSMLEYAIRCYADHCRETPAQTAERLWSKPGGSR